MRTLRSLSLKLGAARYEFVIFFARSHANYQASLIGFEARKASEQMCEKWDLKYILARRDLSDLLRLSLFLHGV